MTPLMPANSVEQREYIAGRPSLERGTPKIEEKPKCSTLPEEFVPFRLRGDRREAPYLSYLRGRGLTDQTVALYRMGFADTGFLSGRVIVPSFDSLGSVNFWSARSIHSNEFIRYRLPQASKNIVSNEHMIDWSAPVYLVEGIFDEIAIGPQAISIYGKFAQPHLALRLVQERPPMTFVCLDSDAWNESITLLEKLVGYDLPCSLLDLDGKDPGSIGSTGVSQAVTRSSAVTGSAGLVGVRI